MAVVLPAEAVRAQEQELVLPQVWRRCRQQGQWCEPVLPFGSAVKAHLLIVRNAAMSEDRRHPTRQAFAAV